jgi:hypothetical protein
MSPGRFDKAGSGRSDFLPEIGPASVRCSRRPCGFRLALYRLYRTRTSARPSRPLNNFVFTLDCFQEVENMGKQEVEKFEF